MCSGKDTRLYTDVLSERKMRQCLENYLISLGWYPDVSPGSNNGIDILARSERRKWIIRIKYLSFTQPDPVNAFVSALGEILQRMEDPGDKFSIAVPDILPFSRLWKRLPLLTKQRTGITALFVNPAGQVREDVN